MEAPPLSSGVLPSRQQYHIGDYPDTPPPSVYQVTHGTALQAAERHVRHLSCGWYPTTGMSSTCKAKWFIPVYRLGEDGGLHFNEGADMLLIWLLRARSYKTKAEA